MIYLTHGIVPQWSRERISHALLLPKLLFSTHLKQRRTKYVPLMQALAGEGDALTIDDATHAGFEAALLARQHGHAVSWFVNGIHVDLGLQYFPFQISCMLDCTKRTDCWFEDRNWRLELSADRRALRLHLKQVYMRMRSQEEIDQLVETVSCCLGIASSLTEVSLTTVTSMELKCAAARGVDLQDHGWSHLNPLVFSEQERTAEVRLNGDYLSQFGKSTARVFAPPFGKRASLVSNTVDFILLADRALVSGCRDGNIMNRRALSSSDLTFIADRVKKPPLRASMIDHADDGSGLL